MFKIECSGIIKKVSNIRSGVGSRGGQWKRQTFVLESLDENNQSIVEIQLVNDKVDEFQPMVKEGAEVFVKAHVSSHTYHTEKGDERWITEVKAYYMRPYDEIPEGATRVQDIAADVAESFKA